MSKLFISNYMVMKSNAGYYVGLACYEEMDDGEWLPQPYDRLGGYSETREEAESELGDVKRCGDDIETMKEFDARFLLHKAKLKLKKGVTVRRPRPKTYNLDFTEVKPGEGDGPIWVIQEGDECHDDQLPGWYFSDECEQLHGPFGTFEETVDIYKRYCLDIL
jgi:hypothetical protein